MIDFIDGYYTTRDPKTSDGYDRERAQQTAVGAVLDYEKRIDSKAKYVPSLQVHKSQNAIRNCGYSQAVTADRFKAYFNRKGYCEQKPEILLCCAFKVP